MTIYTRKGDSGQTSLFSGERVEKDDLRVEAYGTVDELNSILGMAASLCRTDRTLEILNELQEQLFVGGGELASGGETPSIGAISEEDWRVLEQWIDELTAQIPKLKNFILPGGTQGSATLHLARAVCRRAERLIVRLSREAGINPELITYINRLSDLLFTLARYENILDGGSEVTWKGGTRG